jgi:hypothetical protein
MKTILTLILVAALGLSASAATDIVPKSTDPGNLGAATNRFPVVFGTNGQFSGTVTGASFVGPLTGAASYLAANYFYPEQFGADGDSDDSAAWQAMFDAATTNRLAIIDGRGRHYNINWDTNSRAYGIHSYSPAGLKNKMVVNNVNFHTTNWTGTLWTNSAGYIQVNNPSFSTLAATNSDITAFASGWQINVSAFIESPRFYGFNITNFARGIYLKSQNGAVIDTANIFGYRTAGIEIDDCDQGVLRSSYIGFQWQPSAFDTDFYTGVGRAEWLTNGVAIKGYRSILFTIEQGCMFNWGKQAIYWDAGEGDPDGNSTLLTIMDSDFEATFASPGTPKIELTNGVTLVMANVKSGLNGGSNGIPTLALYDCPTEKSLFAGAPWGNIVLYPATAYIPRFTGGNNDFWVTNLTTVSPHVASSAYQIPDEGTIPNTHAPSEFEVVQLFKGNDGANMGAISLRSGKGIGLTLGADNNAHTLTLGEDKRFGVWAYGDSDNASTTARRNLFSWAGQESTDRFSIGYDMWNSSFGPTSLEFGTSPMTNTASVRQWVIDSSGNLTDIVGENVITAGTIVSTNFIGNGAGLTNLSGSGDVTAAGQNNFSGSNYFGGAVFFNGITNYFANDVALGAGLSSLNDISTGGSFNGDGSGLTGLDASQIAVGTVDDARLPATISSDITGNAATVTVVDGTDSTSYVGIFDSATGSLAAKTDAGLTYNASTGDLTVSGGISAATANIATMFATNVTLYGIRFDGAANSMIWADGDGYLRPTNNAAGLTNLLYAPIVTAGDNVTVTATTNATTGQRTYEIDATGGGVDASGVVPGKPLIAVPGGATGWGDPLLLTANIIATGGTTPTYIGLPTPSPITGTAYAPSATATSSQIVGYSTNAAAVENIIYNRGAYSPVVLTTNLYFGAVARMTNSTNVRFVVGLGNNTPITTQASTANAIYFRASTNSSNWFFCSGNGSAHTASDTGIAFDTNFHVFEIYPADNSGTNFTGKIDGLQCPTNVVVATASAAHVIGLCALETGVVKAFEFKHIRYAHQY